MTSKHDGVKPVPNSCTGVTGWITFSTRRVQCVGVPMFDGEFRSPSSGPLAKRSARQVYLGWPNRSNVHPCTPWKPIRKRDQPLYNHRCALPCDRVCESAQGCNR